MMAESIEALTDAKMQIVLNLLRTNSTADEALKITQAVVNLANGRNQLLNAPLEGRPTKPKGASA